MKDKLKKFAKDHTNEIIIATTAVAATVLIFTLKNRDTKVRLEVVKEINLNLRELFSDGVIVRGDGIKDLVLQYNVDK